MQPYQEATEETIKRGERPGVVATQAAKVGLGAAASYTGLPMAARVLPFLNKYIPAGLAVKGLSKVDPRLGNFVETALKNGGTIEEAKEFIKEKIDQDPAIQDVKKDNPIFKFSKKLGKLIDDAIGTGHTIDEVEGMARSPGNKFKKDIDQIEKSFGMTFKDLLRSIYGGEKEKKPEKKQLQAMPEQAMPDQRISIAQQQQQQQQQQPSDMQSSPLFQMMKNINERMASL